MSDKLAKELHRHLYNAAESNGERGWPVSAGWLDFLAGDRPETNDPLEMAVEAVWYLADCESGEWNKPKLCFQAAFAFLKVKFGELPFILETNKLPELLAAPPNKLQLKKWFERAYP